MDVSRAILYKGWVMFSGGFLASNLHNITLTAIFLLPQLINLHFFTLKIKNDSHITFLFSFCK